MDTPGSSCVVLRHDDFGGKADVRSMGRWLGDQLESPYDTGEIARIAARITLGTGPDWDEDGSWICSELVWGAYLYAGISLPWDGRGFIAPSTVVAAPKMRGLARLS